MNILVTGGAGYIGNHIVDLLLPEHKVIIVDDLSTGSIDAIKNKDLFYQVDIRDYDELKKVFKDNQIDGVIHLAAKLDVEESVSEPYKYFDTNITGTLQLLKCMKEYDVQNIVFSSTAAVYGEVFTEDKIDELAGVKPVNPYGLSKLYGESMIEAGHDSYNLNYIIFRYFNVAGGSKVGYGIEQMKTLIPRVVSSYKNNLTLNVFGSDYPTHDGTCIRDYIHVVDLAKAHIVGLEKLVQGENVSGIYNLGSSAGFSVLEVINVASSVLNHKIDYKLAPRREGDPFFSVASSQKAFDKLGWKTEVNDLKDIISDMYEKNK